MLRYSNRLTLTENSINSGKIRIADNSSSTYNSAVLMINGNVGINGTGLNPGEIIFGSSYQNSISCTSATDILTVGEYQTVRTDSSAARGAIHTDIINNGYINADEGTVTLRSIEAANNNSIKASNGGNMLIDTSVIDNTSGTITAGLNSIVKLSHTELCGGTVNGSGTVDIAGTVNLDAGGRMQIDNVSVILNNSDYIRANGNLTNNTTITLNDNSSSIYNAAGFYTNGDLAIDGTGTILFDSSYQNKVDYTNITDTLTLGSEQTITTSDNSKGEIKTKLINNGIIDADNGTIKLNITDKTNNSLMRAADTGTLELTGMELYNNGIIEIDGSSQMKLSNSTIHGGMISGNGKIEITVAGTFSGINESVILDSVSTDIGSNDLLTVKGSIKNNGTVNIKDISSNIYNSASMKIDGTVTLDGTGQVIFGSTYDNNISSTNVSDRLIIGRSQSLVTSSGNKGVVKTQIDNRGTFDFAGNMMIDAAGGNHHNSGLIRIMGSTGITGNSFRNCSDGIIKGSGTLDVSGTDFINAGIVAAGDSVGKLDIIGNYHQTTGTLQVEISSDSTYDLLDISGSAEMDGTIDVVLLSGYTPLAGRVFDIVTAAGSITDLGLSMAIDDLGSWNINIFSENVLQIEYIPEPATILILAAGMIILRPGKK